MKKQLIALLAISLGVASLYARVVVGQNGGGIQSAASIAAMQKPETTQEIPKIDDRTPQLDASTQAGGGGGGGGGTTDWASITTFDTLTTAQR